MVCIGAANTWNEGSLRLFKLFWETALLGFACFPGFSLAGGIHTVTPRIDIDLCEWNRTWPIMAHYQCFEHNQSRRDTVSRFTSCSATIQLTILLGYSSSFWPQFLPQSPISSLSISHLDQELVGSTDPQPTTIPSSC